MYIRITFVYPYKCDCPVLLATALHSCTDPIIWTSETSLTVTVQAEKIHKYWFNNIHSYIAT